MSTTALTMTVEEAAKALRIGRSLAYELARRGDLPTIRLGKRLLISKAALDRLLANAEGPDGTPNAGDGHAA